MYNTHYGPNVISFRGRYSTNSVTGKRKKKRR